MKKLILLLALATAHAQNMVEIQTMAAESGDRPGVQAIYQLVGPAKATHGNRESSPRRTVAGEHEPNPAFPTYKPRRDKTAYSLVEASALGLRPARDDHNCPCGEDCACPDPMVCKNGDCKKNYVVFFTASWCAPCRKMYPRIEQLRKDGYIVYVIDADKFKDAAADFKVDSLPTSIVMDKGQEVERFIGVVELEKITEICKTKDDQDKDTPYDYDLR